MGKKKKKSQANKSAQNKNLKTEQQLFIMFGMGSYIPSLLLPTDHPSFYKLKNLVFAENTTLSKYQKSDPNTDKTYIYTSKQIPRI